MIDHDNFNPNVCQPSEYRTSPSMSAGLFKEGLCAAGIYLTARRIYDLVMRPSVWHHANQLVQFYGKFVGPGDLVFDVGANLGRRTEAFVRLGARVVAIEPNEECCRRLRSLFRFSPVTVEPIALGRQGGAMLLRRCPNISMSSMSDCWIEAMKTGRFPYYEWNEGEMVPVSTLDSLVRKYGRPQFLKIDVEGFEGEVLEGLTRPISALSFECNPECVDLATGCIKRLMMLGHYQFNLSVGETLKLELSNWIDRDQILRELEEKAGVSWKTHADVYARLV